MFLTVIEISCGEYGDNIKNLVNAIKNGKLDVREGYNFPEKEPLNNLPPVSKEGTNVSTVVETLSVPVTHSGNKDKNDANNIQEKFNETNNSSSGKNNNNGGLFATTNDISKQSWFFFFWLLIKI